jgi:integrase
MTKSPFYPVLLCALKTGMRAGEIKALEWDDIDFGSRLIAVNKSLSRGIGGTTKNRKSRKIDMTPQPAETLKDVKLSKKKTILKKGGRQAKGYL